MLNVSHISECQRHMNVSNYEFDPWSRWFQRPLCSFRLWPSAAITHDGPSSHRSSLSPLSHSHWAVSWVRSHKPLRLRFIGWRLIHPLYTFQITGFNQQNGGNRTRRGVKRGLLYRHKDFPHTCSVLESSNKFDKDFCPTPDTAWVTPCGESFLKLDSDVSLVC